MDSSTQRGFPDLLSDMVTQASSLFRSEVRLVRAEVDQKISQATSGATLALIGAVLLMPALVILMTAGVAALVEAGMSDAVAALLVGGGGLAIGAILLFIGVNKLKAENLSPTATISQLRSDASLAKDQVRT